MYAIFTENQSLRIFWTPTSMIVQLQEGYLYLTQYMTDYNFEGDAYLTVQEEYAEISKTV